MYKINCVTLMKYYVKSGNIKDSDILTVSVLEYYSKDILRKKLQSKSDLTDSESLVLDILLTHDEACRLEDSEMQELCDKSLRMFIKGEGK